jgi:hypothetical protein
MRRKIVTTNNSADHPSIDIKRYSHTKSLRERKRKTKRKRKKRKKKRKRYSLGKRKRK